MGDWTGTVPTILAGDRPTGDDWKNVLDELSAISAAPTSWTPTLTNLTLGNGTQVAKYRRVGKLVDFEWHLILGSTSAVGTGPRLTLPASMSTDFFTNKMLSSDVWFVDSGAATWRGVAVIVAANEIRLDYFTAAPALATVTATAPFAFGTADWLQARGWFYTD